MDFYFIDSEALLTKSVVAGGLGLSRADLEGVERWQRDLKYTFSWHTGTHGDRCVYIRNGGLVGRNMPCIWLDGSKALTGRGNVPADAAEVVSQNTAVFIKAYDNFYGTGGSTEDSRIVSLPRLNFICSNCGQKKEGYVSSIALGLEVGSYPPACPKQHCGGRFRIAGQ
ncbi:MAG: hypothetical protein KYX62_12500 [Pseudomonadota bacterium]|nr:hypothetical protein [Pseudomonadota bacterium]